MWGGQAVRGGGGDPPPPPHTQHTHIHACARTLARAHANAHVHREGESSGRVVAEVAWGSDRLPGRSREREILMLWREVGGLTAPSAE